MTRRWWQCPERMPSGNGVAGARLRQRQTPFPIGKPDLAILAAGLCWRKERGGHWQSSHGIPLMLVKHGENRAAR